MTTTMITYMIYYMYSSTIELFTEYVKAHSSAEAVRIFLQRKKQEDVAIESVEKVKHEYEIVYVDTINHKEGCVTTTIAYSDEQARKWFFDNHPKCKISMMTSRELSAQTKIKL